MSRRATCPLFLSRIALAFLPALVLLAVSHGPANAASAQSVDDAMYAFEDAIEEQMEAWQTPGLAVAVVKDGKVAYAKGFGYRDRGEALEVTDETLFPIGSCTKAFTGTAMALLADEGKLDLDAPVAGYIPWFRMADDYAAQNVTARDMLLHRTGLPRYDSFLALRPDLTRKELVEALRYLAPDKPFRYAFAYDNVMYAAAGFLLEQVSKKSWEDFVRERLFAPLGIEAAFFSVNDLAKERNAAKPYMVVGGKLTEVPYANLDAVGPAGSIISNVREMAKWIIFNLDKGKAGDEQIISEKAMAGVHAPQIMTGKPGSPEMPFSAYGLGWGVTDYRGHMFLTHDGETDGFHASISFMPDDGLGVVILTNRSGGDLPGCAGLSIYDRLLGLDPLPLCDKALADSQTKAKADEAKAEARAESLPTGTSPSHPLADYAGKYKNPAYGVLTVTAEGDALSAALGPEQTPLVHAMYDIFATPEGGLDAWTLRFTMNDAGVIDKALIPLEPGLPDISFKRMAETKEKKKKK